MCVLIICRVFGDGWGSTLSSYQLLETYIENNINAKLLLLTSNNKSKIQLNTRNNDKIFSAPFKLKEILKIIHDLKCSFLIGSASSVFSLVANISDLTKVPYSLIIRGGSISKQTLPSKELKKIIKRAHRIACVSDHLCNLIQNEINISPISLKHVLPPKFNKHNQKKVWNHEITITYIGQFTQRKGVLRLPKIIRLIQNSIDRKIIFKLIGDGELLEYVKQSFKNDCYNIHFLGALSNIQVSKILPECHFLILPSIREGRPRVLLEAISENVIPIVTKIPAHIEILSNQANRWMWDFESIEEITNIIYNLINYKEERDFFWRSISLDGLSNQQEYLVNAMALIGKDVTF